MSKWMVDAKGDGEGDQKSMTQALADQNFVDYIGRHGGGLGAAVQRRIAELNLVATDRGGGVGGWHLGVPFDDLDEAAKYLGFMTAVFARAIAAGMLRFELKTWSREAWKAQ